MELLVSYILLIGVLLSMMLTVTGLALNWLKTGQLGIEYPIASVNLFEFVLINMQRVFSGAVSPQLLVNMGIAALMLTPYMRVLVSVLYFASAEHNWKYAVFTGFVLGVLTYSLFLR